MNIFTAVKNRCILHGRVNVMKTKINELHCHKTNDVVFLRLVNADQPRHPLSLISRRCALPGWTFTLFLKMDSDDIDKIGRLSRLIYFILFIQCFKRETRFAVIAILFCGPLCKHIYIYTSNIITSQKTKITL